MCNRYISSSFFLAVKSSVAGVRVLPRDGPDDVADALEAVGRDAEDELGAEEVVGGVVGLARELAGLDHVAKLARALAAVLRKYSIFLS